MGQESNSDSSTVNGRRGLKSRLCSYPLFLTLHLLGNKTPIPLSLNSSICTNNSFNSLAIHPELCHLSRLNVCWKTPVGFQPQTPCHGSLPLPGARRLRRHNSYSASGMAGLVGLQASSSSRDPGAGMRGCVCSPAAPLAVGQESCDRPGAEPVLLRTWGAQQWFMTAKVRHAESLFIQKNKQFKEKKASAFRRLSLCRPGAVEKLSLGRGTNPSTPVNFHRLTHAHPIYRKTGR